MYARTVLLLLVVSPESEGSLHCSFGWICSLLLMFFNGFQRPVASCFKPFIGVLQIHTLLTFCVIEISRYQIALIHVRMCRA